MTDLADPFKQVPFAWVIPGSDTANDRGFIDAMAWEEGEFTKPLYAAQPPAADLWAVIQIAERNEFAPQISRVKAWLNGLPTSSPLTSPNCRSEQ